MLYHVVSTHTKNNKFLDPIDSKRDRLIVPEEIDGPDGTREFRRYDTNLYAFIEYTVLGLMAIPGLILRLHLTSAGNGRRSGSSPVPFSVSGDDDRDGLRLEPTT
jgi:hypothetical protein